MIVTAMIVLTVATRPPTARTRAHASTCASAGDQVLCDSKPLDPMAGCSAAISPGRPSARYGRGQAHTNGYPLVLPAPPSTSLPESQAPSVKHELPAAVPDFDSHSTCPRICTPARTRIQHARTHPPMCEYMCEHMHMHTHRHARARNTHAHAQTCARPQYTCTCTCSCTCSTRTDIRAPAKHMHTHMHMHMHTRAYTLTRMHICTRKCTHTDMRAPAIHIHMHMYSHMHPRRHACARNTAHAHVLAHAHVHLHPCPHTRICPRAHVHLMCSCRCV